MNDHTFIIAEMSANHCGDFALAKKIIVAAKAAGRMRDIILLMRED